MCLFPWKASLDPDGGRPSHDLEGSLCLPCGKCSECITLRATGWATRARHEISLHQDNCFLTLTYDDLHLPSHLIVKDRFQRFLKRLRKQTKKKLRYIVSHEYGSKTFRPHHHCMIFGYQPSNWKYLQTTKSGSKIYRSDEIDELWKEENETLGFHSIGEANEKTAFYIAAYALKGKTHTFMHQGEKITVNDSFDCSKRPAIGLEYLLENAHQLVRSGEVLPRYYQKRLERHFPDLLQEYQDRQASKIKNRGSHEKLAKFVVSEQKKLLNNSEFRHQNDDLDFINKKAILKEEAKIYKEYTHETFHTTRSKSRNLFATNDVAK